MSVTNLSDKEIQKTSLTVLNCNCEVNTCQLSRIVPVDSQVLTVYHGNEPVNITLDSGATSSFITLNICKRLNLDILPNGQMARLGD